MIAPLGLEGGPCGAGGPGRGRRGPLGPREGRVPRRRSGAGRSPVPSDRCPPPANTSPAVVRRPPCAAATTFPTRWRQQPTGAGLDGGPTRQVRRGAHRWARPTTGRNVEAAAEPTRPSRKRRTAASTVRPGRRRAPPRDRSGECDTLGCPLQFGASPPGRASERVPDSRPGARDARPRSGPDPGPTPCQRPAGLVSGCQHRRPWSCPRPARPRRSATRQSDRCRGSSARR